MALSTDEQKRAAARAAAALVQHGDRVGLGTGTTAVFLLQALAQRVRDGLQLIAVPTSEASGRLAASLGLRLSDLEREPELDIDIDGADEVDPVLNLIKGRGGALLREKIVACASRRFVVIVDQSKPVRQLGSKAPLPVEVVPFGWKHTRELLEALGAEALLRGGDQPFRTDSGNFILDCRFAQIDDVPRLATSIKSITGVVEHGFFLGMASEVIVGRADGSLDRLQRGVDGQT